MEPKTKGIAHKWKKRSRLFVQSNCDRRPHIITETCLMSPQKVRKNLSYINLRWTTCCLLRLSFFATQSDYDCNTNLLLYEKVTVTNNVHVGERCARSQQAFGVERCRTWSHACSGRTHWIVLCKTWQRIISIY